MYFSVIIINYEGKLFLKNCIDSLLKQKFDNFEIIIIDNNSSDRSIEDIHENNKIKILKLEKNIGFANACNFGLKYTKGEIIFFLNNDTVVTENLFLNTFRKYQKNEEIIYQPKIVQMKKKDLIDSNGSFITYFGLLYHYGLSSLEKKYNEDVEIFSTKGAAFFVPRNIIKKIGLFNKYFHSYYEETDFCHRAHIYGYKIIFSPELGTVEHYIGGSSKQVQSSYYIYNYFKNKISSILINYSIKSLTLEIINYYSVLIFFLLFNIAKLKIVAVKTIIKSQLDFLKNIRNVLNERKKVQKNRIIPDHKIKKMFFIKPKLKYFFYLLKGYESFEKYNYENDLLKFKKK